MVREQTVSYSDCVAHSAGCKWKSPIKKYRGGLTESEVSRSPDLLKAGWPADEWLPLDRRRFQQHPFYRQRRHCMNLPNAPIAREGFFATHFFTVRLQEKSKDFYLRILGGKVITPENPCYIKPG